MKSLTMENIKINLYEKQITKRLGNKTTPRQR